MPSLPQGPQNPAPNVEDLRNKIAKAVSDRKCADFIRNLINKASELTGNPAAGDDALSLFNIIAKQGGVVYGDTIRRAYGFDGSTIHGSIAGGDAQIELAPPYPINIRNPRVAADIAATQAIIAAGDALHETIHLAGRGYDDFLLAKALADLRGVQRPDFSGMPYKVAIRRASEYWGNPLSDICKPR